MSKNDHEISKCPPRGNFKHRKSPRAFQISNMEHSPSQNLPECTPRQADNHHPKMFPKSPKCRWGVILSTRNVLEMSEIIHGEHFAMQKVLMNVQMPHFRGQKSSLRKFCSFGILYSRGHSGPPQHAGVYTAASRHHRRSCNRLPSAVRVKGPWVRWGVVFFLFFSQ